MVAVTFWRIAHRASWLLHRGPIPDGMCVLHSCDNPPCVRPEHLFLGTQADNVADMDAKGRRRSRSVGNVGEANPGAKLTEAQVREIRARCASGETQAVVALDCGVDQSVISKVVNRRIWSRVI